MEQQLGWVDTKLDQQEVKKRAQIMANSWLFYNLENIDNRIK